MTQAQGERARREGAKGRREESESCSKENLLHFQPQRVAQAVLGTKRKHDRCVRIFFAKWQMMVLLAAYSVREIEKIQKIEKWWMLQLKGFQSEIRERSPKWCEWKWNQEFNCFRWIGPEPLDWRQNDLFILRYDSTSTALIWRWAFLAFDNTCIIHEPGRTRGRDCRTQRLLRATTDR